MVILGFVVDIFGALILATPDIPQYKKWTYGGSVRNAYLRLTLDERAGRISPDTRYYNAFRTALTEHMLPGDVPENATFEFKSGNVDDIMIINDEEFQPETGPISLGNVERMLIDTYRREESRFRLLGILLLVIGFSAQVSGMLVDTFYIYNLCL